jgi:hypothetical protein
MILGMNHISQSLAGEPTVDLDPAPWSANSRCDRRLVAFSMPRGGRSPA